MSVSRKSSKLEACGGQPNLAPGAWFLSSGCQILLETLRAIESKGFDSALCNGETADGPTGRRSDGCTNLPVLRLHILERDVLRHSIRQEGGGDRPDAGRLPPRGVSKPRIGREEVESVDQTTAGEEIVETSYHFFRPERGGPP